MNRRVITFLGTVARDTEYLYRGTVYRGRVFGEAMRQFLDFDDMLVFITREAREMAYPVLEELGDPRIHAVDIPTAQTSEEMWQIFDVLTRHVDAGDRVIFDITHALRYIPFLVFLAAAYLRRAKEVQIEQVLYGALELGRNGPAPVIDLTDMVRLLDWLMATSQFIYTGDARYLAHLLNQEGARRKSSALRKAGQELEALSLGMMLCRPLEGMEGAGRLQRALTNAQGDLVQWAHPFSLLVDRIEREYAARALREPTAPENLGDSLRQQLGLIQWYMDNNQVMQAVTLAREWVVTAVGWRMKGEFVLNVKDREALERGLGGVARGKRGGEDGIRPPPGLNSEGKIIWEWSEREILQRLWNLAIDIRNDLNHAGMRYNARKARRLARAAREKLMPCLEELARVWGLAEAGNDRP